MDHSNKIKLYRFIFQWLLVIVAPILFVIIGQYHTQADAPLFLQRLVQAYAMIAVLLIGIYSVLQAKKLAMHQKKIVLSLAIITWSLSGIILCFSFIAGILHDIMFLGSYVICSFCLAIVVFAAQQF